MVDQTDPDAIAKALISLLQDPALAQRLAAEAKQQVEASASYESQMAKMNELYEKISRKGAKVQS
jgi:glycosyltransferase involved in cell wall biosynthesis